MEDNKPKVFGPCSRKQKIIWDDDETDILLIGGGKPLCLHLKTPL